MRPGLPRRPGSDQACFWRGPHCSAGSMRTTVRPSPWPSLDAPHPRPAAGTTTPSASPTSRRCRNASGRRLPWAAAPCWPFRRWRGRRWRVSLCPAAPGAIGKSAVGKPDQAMSAGHFGKPWREIRRSVYSPPDIVMITSLSNDCILGSECLPANRKISVNRQIRAPRREGT